MPKRTARVISDRLPGQQPEHQLRQSSGKGSIIAGLVLIFVGGFFLMRNFFTWLDFGYVWPVILIIVGLVMLIKKD